MNQNHFTVIGGDYRSVAVAQKLSELGYTVSVFGFNSDVVFSGDITYAETLKEACENAAYIILPLPYSRNARFLNTPLYDSAISMVSFADTVKQGQMVFAGKIDEVFRSMLEAKGIKFCDYSMREEFSVLNAIPTAEGALQVAFKELPHTINGSNCLVAGYGRIGKILSHFLHGLGAKVTVSARRQSDLAWIKSMGYTAVSSKDIKNLAHSFQVVFNTVPSCLFDRELLCRLSKDVLVVDLASSPGGVDFETAKKLGINAIHALSLPGKVAPHTAGTIIATTVLNLIAEQEVNV